jgi:hypothetical protein
MSADDQPVGSEESDIQMSGTVAGLLSFLEWATRTGELSSNTAAAYKTAVTRILEIDGEAWTSTDVATIDVDRQLDRFTRLRGSRYNPASLRTYRNRLSAAVTHYLRYLERPESFRANPARRPSGSKKTDTSPSEPSPKVRRDHNRPEPVTHAVEREPAGNLVQYPFPLRSDLMAYLSLPRDLRSSEADRIAAFVASLAIDMRADRPGDAPKEL